MGRYTEKGKHILMINEKLLYTCRRLVPSWHINPYIAGGRKRLSVVNSLINCAIMLTNKRLALKIFSDKLKKIVWPHLTYLKVIQGQQLFGQFWTQWSNEIFSSHLHVILLMVCEAEMHAGDNIGPHSSLNITSNHNIYWMWHTNLGVSRMCI